MRANRYVAGLALIATTRCAQAVGIQPRPEPPTVAVTMTEMAFEHPETVPQGRVVFEVSNAGELAHRLVLVPLSEDFPPIREQLAGDQRRFVDPQAGIPNQRPGANTSFAVDLVPGRYAFICFTVDPDGTNHALVGMASEFRVPGDEAGRAR